MIGKCSENVKLLFFLLFPYLLKVYYCKPKETNRDEYVTIRVPTKKMWFKYAMNNSLFKFEFIRKVRKESLVSFYMAEMYSREAKKPTEDNCRCPITDFAEDLIRS